MKHRSMLPALALTCVLGLVLFLATGIENAWAKGVRLVWDPVLEGMVAGYNVYRSEQSGGPYTRLNASTISSPLYSDTGIEAGKTYYYVVTSVGTDGSESRYSAEIKVVLQSFAPVAATSTLAANAGSDLFVGSGQMVTLSGSGFQPEGKMLTYRWAQVSGPTVTIARSDRAEAAFLAPVTSQDTKLVFSLTITAPDGSSAVDVVAVVVRKALNAN